MATSKRSTREKRLTETDIRKVLLNLKDSGGSTYNQIRGCILSSSDNLQEGAREKVEIDIKKAINRGIRKGTITKSKDGQRFKVGFTGREETSSKRSRCGRRKRRQRKKRKSKKCKSRGKKGKKSKKCTARGNRPYCSRKTKKCCRRRRRCKRMRSKLPYCSRYRHRCCRRRKKCR